MEHILYDTENHNNHDKLSHPVPYGADWSTERAIHYCYYRASVWTLTSLNGTFSSPYYPHHYNNKASCKWNVRVPWNYTISLTFEHFALEKRCCACDYLEVWETLSNGTEVLIVTYCDAKNKRPHPSKQIRSRTSNMTVLFYSNEIKTAKGFKASYEAIPLFSDVNPTTDKASTANYGDSTTMMMSS